MSEMIMLLSSGSWLQEFCESFKEHFIEEVKIGDIGEEINKSILPWKHYFEIGNGFKVLLTDAVIVSWIAIALVLFLIFRMARKPQLKPGKTQMVLEMHLDELEQSLALLRLRGVVSACRHGRSRTGVGDAVAGYIRDTIYGTGCLAANADLFNCCHS